MMQWKELSEKESRSSSIHIVYAMVKQIKLRAAPKIEFKWSVKSSSHQIAIFDNHTIPYHSFDVISINWAALVCW